MKDIILSRYLPLYCILFLLLLDAATTIDAFAVGEFKWTSLATTMTTTTTMTRSLSKQTKLFVSTTPLVHNNNNDDDDDIPIIVDESLREEDPIEFIFQEVDSKMDANAIFK